MTANPKIIVIGAGLGGVPMAFELRELFGRSAQITVVNDSEWFYFVPSNPWVAFKWRTPEDVKVHLPPIFTRLGISFAAVGAKRVRPDANTVELNNGSQLPYDYLVIATGPQLGYDEVEGLGPQANTRSICHSDHAARTAESWEAFCKAPGPMVVGAVQGASCFGPAYEFALTAVTDLRRRRIRDRVPMTFVTSEPYIGHLGLGGVGDTKGMLESLLRDRDIRWITNAKVDRVALDTVEVTEVDENGAPKKAHKLPSKFSMFIPAFRGVDCLFVLIDKYQRNPKYRNIFAVGVCTAIPAYEQTPVAVGVPKTGYMIESMVAAAARNIAELAAGKEPTHEPTWNAVCLADFGDSGIAFVALPQIPPRNVNWSSQGYWVHLAKVAFEKYFLRKVRTGSSEPGYERVVMKALGIERLRNRVAS